MKRTRKTKRPQQLQSPGNTFTLRDLNRQPAKVLAACDTYGTVRIRTRDGRSYSLKSETTSAKSSVVESLLKRRQRFREQLRAAGFAPPTQDEMDRIHRVIAGEE